MQEVKIYSIYLYLLVNSPDEANSRNFLPGARNKIRLLDEPLSIENDFPLYQAILVD